MTVEAILGSIGDEELTHYGIKGMKWGVRRTDEQLSRSEDSAAAAASMAKVKSQGISSLSNAEVKKLNERLQLEKTFAQLNPPPASKLKKAMKTIDTAITVNKKLNKLGLSPVQGVQGVLQKQVDEVMKTKKAAGNVEKVAEKVAKATKTSTGKKSSAGKAGLDSLDALIKIAKASESSSLSSRPSSYKSTGMGNRVASNYGGNPLDMKAVNKAVKNLQK